MKIISAEFLKSAFEPSHWPADGLPEIAFLGRSNVGKSSMLNALLRRKGLARTSNTPGRTQSINFFRINDQMLFVDLPGYGYAKVSKTMREGWGKMAEQYLSGREELKLAIQLVDSRHEATALDLQLSEWLAASGLDHLVVATKADKLSNNQVRKHVAGLEKQLGTDRIIAFSAITGAGREAVLGEIAEAVKK
jgi:GTP-binding protein